MASDRWTETALCSLGSDEYDFLEFKGSAWMHNHRVIVQDFPAAFSKQLSAFANGAGGRIILGLDDHGEIDGGIPVDLKKGGTRSWLEDIAPGLVDPPLSALNVHEVRAEDEGSSILEGHAVYVVEVRPSDSAPHQAIDHRYYLRIAGKSRPMGHVHIQDVLRRTQHPRVHMRRLAPYGPEERITTDPRGPKVLVAFRVYLRNHGRRLANHVGLEIVVPRPLINQAARRRTLQTADVSLTQRPGTINFFHHHQHPMFPTQDLHFLQFWVSLHRGNLEAVTTGMAEVSWKVYADDAPPSTGSKSLGEYAVIRDAARWLRAAADP